MAIGDSKPSFFRRLTLRSSVRRGIALHPASQVWNDLLDAPHPPAKWHNLVEASRKSLDKIKDAKEQDEARGRLGEITEQILLKEEKLFNIKQKIKEIEVELEKAEEKLFLCQIVFPDATKELDQIKIEIELCDQLIDKYKNWHHLLNEMYPKTKPKHVATQQVFLSDKVAALQLRKHDLEDKQKHLETAAIKPVTANQKASPPQKPPVTRIHHHEYQKIFITHAPMQPNLKFMTECSQHLKGIKQAFSGWFNPDRLVKQLYAITKKAKNNINRTFPNKTVGPEETTLICHDTFVLLFRQLKNKELKSFYNDFTSKTFKTFYKTVLYYSLRPEDLDVFLVDPVKVKREQVLMDRHNGNLMTRINTLAEFLYKGPLLALQTVMREKNFNYRGINYYENCFDLDSITLNDTTSKSKKYIEHFVKDYYSITGFIDPATKPNKADAKTLRPSLSPQLSMA